MTEVVGWCCAVACVVIAGGFVVAVLRSHRPLVEAREIHRDDLIRHAVANDEPLAVDGGHRLWTIWPDRDTWQAVCRCRWLGKERDALDYARYLGAARVEWRRHVAAYPKCTETTEMLKQQQEGS